MVNKAEVFAGRQGWAVTSDGASRGPDNIATPGGPEGIKDVLRRVTAAQPEISLQNHEGYYRHADIAALVTVAADASSDMRRVAHLAENMTIHHEDALAMILAIAKAWGKRF